MRALADALTTLAPENATPMLEQLIADKDARVLPAALRAWHSLKLPGLEKHLAAALTREDVPRAGGGGVDCRRAEADRRCATRSSPRGSGPAPTPATTRAGRRSRRWRRSIRRRHARPMEETLADRDWSMRLRAARWLVSQDPASDALSRIRPAPVTVAADLYEAPRLITPSFSPQVYIDTAKGTVQVELAVLDAPLTVENFIALARRGYFDGLPIHRVVPAFVVQDGDPRGDGSGGPGLQHPRRTQRSRRMRAAPSAWRCRGPTPAAASGS